MKVKIVFFTALFIFIASMPVMAQITFGAWGRAVITPLAFSGEHSAVSAATSTWGDVPSIGFSANGTSPQKHIGFFINFDFGMDMSRNMPAIIGDNAKAWVTPFGLLLPEQFNMLKLTAGWFKEEDLRGKIGASEFGSWILPNGSKDEDNIFQRFNAKAGAHFKIEPLMWLDSEWNGLTIQGAFGTNALGARGNGIRAILNLFNNEDNTTAGNYNENSEGYDGDRLMSAADVFKAMQIALSYQMPGVGLLRFQFIGNNRKVFRWGESSSGAAVDSFYEVRLVTGLETNKDADIIEGAFLFDGINGLKIDVGAKVPLVFSTRTNFIVYPQVVGSDGLVYAQIPNGNRSEYTVQLPYIVAAGLSWVPSFFDILNITARADISFGGTIKSESEGIEVLNGYIMNFWLMPSIKVLPMLRLGIDTGIDIHGLDTLKIKGQNPVKARTDVSKYIDLGFGPWFEFLVSGGRCRLGVVVMLPGSARFKYNGNQANGSPSVYMYQPLFTGDPVISIPISFTYSF